MFPVKYLPAFSNRGAETIQREGLVPTCTSGRINTERFLRNRQGKTSCLEHRGGRSASQPERIGRVNRDKKCWLWSQFISANFSSRPNICSSSRTPVNAPDSIANFLHSSLI